MNSYIKGQFRKYLSEYLTKVHNVKITKNNNFDCPCCDQENTATIYPNNTTKFYCLNPECSFKGDVFELIRKTKNSNMNDDKIADYLSHKLNIKLKESIDNLLDFYEKNNFCLFPIEPGTKEPQRGFKWLDKNHTNKTVWKDWTDRGYGLGLRLGKEGSKVIAIDVDDKKTLEKLKDLLGDNTLIQSTKRGKHWLFSYDSDFDHVNHANLRNKGYEMEVRANNAYVVVAPTSVQGELREWNNKPIQNMTEELKKFLLELIDKDTEEPNKDDEVQKAIDTEKLSVVDLSGRRNDTFVQTLGIFSKWMPKETAYKAMSFLSHNWIDKPIPKKELNAMMNQIKRYRTYDKKQLADEVLKRLEVIKQGTAFQIAGSLKREQKDIEDVLKYLEDQGKVFDSGNRKFHVVNDVEWGQPEETENMPVDFVVPYFNDYNFFDQGEMVIIGASSGRGKSHVCANMIKKLADQGLTVNVINTEPAGKLFKITSDLGVPVDKILVPKKLIKHPTEIELKDNAITIIDWLKPKDGNFAETENTFDHFRMQLEKHKGFLIIFTQTRPKNNEFFAPDLVPQYGSCVAKYCWGNEGKDGENTFFQTEKLRDSKSGLQYLTIPTIFDPKKKTLELRK